MERAVALYRELDQKAEISGTEAILSHTRYRLGAYDDALFHARRAWESASSLGNDAFAAEALLAAGNCEADLGMYETTIKTYKEARRLYARSGELRGDLVTALNTGLCYIPLMRLDEAVTILQTAVEATETLQTPRLRAVAWYYLGLAYERQGKLTDAEAALTISLELRCELGQTGFAHDNIAALLRIASARSQESTVRSLLEKLEHGIVDEMPEGLEDPPGAWLSIVMAYDALGEPGNAARAASAGYEMVMDRASRISDEEARRSYLECVPANRQLVERHRQG